MTLDDINDALRPIIRDALGMGENDVRPANQTGAPTGSKQSQFATVLCAMVQGKGYDALTYANEASPSTRVVETARGQRTVMASVQFFRGDALEKAERLKALMTMSLQTQKLQASGLGFLRSSDVRNLTAVADSFYEERAQIDLFLSFISTEAQSLETYGTFPIGGQVDGNTSSGEVHEP